MSLIKILGVCLLLSLALVEVQAIPIKGGYSFNSYDQAADSDSQLKLSFQSGVGEKSPENVTALIRSFQYRVDYDDKNLSLKSVNLIFDSQLLDTHNKKRDDQLRVLCFPSSASASMSISKDERAIKILIPGPAAFGDSSEKEYAAITTLRGKGYQTPVKMKIHFDQDSEQIILVGNLRWSLKAMGVSDSCFKQAKISENFKVDFQLIIKAN